MRISTKEFFSEYLLFETAHQIATVTQFTLLGLFPLRIVAKDVEILYGSTAQLAQLNKSDSNLWGIK